MPRWHLLISFSLFLLACSTAVRTKNALSKELHQVVIGYYPEYHYSLPPEHPLYQRAKKLQTDIAPREHLFSPIIRQKLGVNQPLKFRLSYIGHDSINHRLIFRLFASNKKPDTIAGWQVQIVYRLPELVLDRIFAWAVPLE